MSYITRIINVTAVISASTLFVACGGGGGGGNGGGTVGISASAPVTVSSANATQVAGASVGASDGLTGNSDGVLGIVPSAVGYGPATDVNIIETIIKQVKSAPQSSSSSYVSTAAVQNINQACDSGSISMTFNDADNDLELSTGDTVSMTASNCSISGVTMNGGMSVNNVLVSGDQLSPPYSMQFSIQSSGFTVTAGSETVGMNGGGTILESSNDNINIVSSFSGNGIEITAGGETLTLTDYQIDETENLATGAYTIDMTATISSSSLGGSVRVTTDVALSGVGAFDPDSGQLTCTGDNSSVTLTVIDSINVQLDVDTDGDSITDNTINQTWAAL